MSVVKSQNSKSQFSPHENEIFGALILILGSGRILSSLDVEVKSQSMQLGKLNTFGKIAIGWTICTAIGIYSFYLSKTSVTQNRYEHMKIRERMRQANIGDYDQKDCTKQ